MADTSNSEATQASGNQVGKNSELGLPFGRMENIKIAFDIDGTLRNNKNGKKGNPQANEDIRTLLRILRKCKNTEIIVWSGSGEVYARQVARELHVDHWVDRYASKTDHPYIQPDIAIDDIQDTAIGKINLIVREK